MKAFFKRLYLLARGIEPYRPCRHDDVEFKVGRYRVRIDWVTYSRRRWLSTRRHSGLPRIHVRFKVPEKLNWMELPLAAHLDYGTKPLIDANFETYFLMRSASDVHNYLHKYFLNIASINQDYPAMLGGELTELELNFMVNLRSELEHRPYDLRLALETATDLREVPL